MIKDNCLVYVRTQRLLYSLDIYVRYATILRNCEALCLCQICASPSPVCAISENCSSWCTSKLHDWLAFICRTDRYGTGWSTDLVTEQALMRSLKTTGCLTRGTDMSETQRIVWLLPMPMCAEINNVMQAFDGFEYSTSEQ